MVEEFNPAPFDKYAEKPEEAARLNAKTGEDLKAGLVGTFPASDPVSATQPSPNKHPNETPGGLWSKLISIFS